MPDPNWISPFESTSDTVELPTFNQSATLAELQQLIGGECFDLRLPFDELKGQLLADRLQVRESVYQVNTVRWGSSMNQTPLGNLWWLAVAKYVELLDGKVEVNGFYNAVPPQHNRDIDEIVDKTALQTASLYPAETFGWHQTLFENLCTFVNHNRSEFADLLGTTTADAAASPILQFEEITAGFQAVVDDEVDLARTKLARLVEELHVFMHRHPDANTSLLVNHERLTPALAKVLYPTMQKQLVNVRLPKDFNEFRGGKGAVKNLFRRTVKRPGDANWQDEAAYQQFARGIVDLLNVDVDSLYEEYSNNTALSYFDPRLVEWGQDHMSVKTLEQVITSDGFELDANSIAQLIIRKNLSYPSCPDAAVKPIKALETKIRDHHELVKSTYLETIKLCATGDSRNFTFYTVVNQLLDLILELPVCAIVEETRTIVRDSLEAVARSAWNQITRIENSVDINVQEAEAKLSQFLGDEITLPNKAEYYERECELIATLMTSEDTLPFDFLYDMMRIIGYHYPDPADVAKSERRNKRLALRLQALQPKLAELQSFLEANHRDFLVELITEGEIQLDDLKTYFSADWCDSLAAEAQTN